METHKELRFTRSRQATTFAILASMLFIGALVLLLLPIRPEDPDLPHPAWGLLPLALAVWCLRIAWSCVRHVYLLLSPIGVEIFPFFSPEKGMQVVPWGQIADVEVGPSRLTLHFTHEKTSGIHLSLAPLGKQARKLLLAAMAGRFPK